MAIIKSFTSLEQSKKLVEILPLESADMFYIAGKGEPIFIGNKMVACGNDDYDALGEPDVLCWSLAALLGVMPEIQGGKPIISLDDNYITYPHMSDLHTKADNLVDACVAMIEKLNESNLV